MLPAAMSNNKSPIPWFLATLAGMVLTGCALMLMVPVLFGVLGDPAPWQGWFVGVLGVLFLAFGWGARRLRPDIPKPHDTRGMNRFL